MKISDALKRALLYGAVRFLGRKVEQKYFHKTPILIVASPRSGTTLLLSILSAVPGIFAVPKQTYAFDKWAEHKGKLIPQRIDKLFRQFILNRISPKVTRWLEKTPGHIRSIEHILNHFNNQVRIIHIVRDGRDVVVSTHPAYRQRKKYWVDPAFWVREVSIGLRFKDHPSVHTLRYEDLINQFDVEIRKILHFIDEPFSDELNDWVDHTEIKESIHWGTNVQDLHRESIGKWKHPEHRERVAEFMKNPQAIQLLKDLGYST